MCGRPGDAPASCWAWDGGAIGRPGHSLPRRPRSERPGRIGRIGPVTGRVGRVGRVSPPARSACVVAEPPDPAGAPGHGHALGLQRAPLRPVPGGDRDATPPPARSCGRWPTGSLSSALSRSWAVRSAPSRSVVAATSTCAVAVGHAVGDDEVRGRDRAQREPGPGRDGRAVRGVDDLGHRAGEPEVAVLVAQEEVAGRAPRVAALRTPRAAARRPSSRPGSPGPAATRPRRRRTRGPGRRRSARACGWPGRRPRPCTSAVPGSGRPIEPGVRPVTLARIASPSAEA